MKVDGGMNGKKKPLYGLKQFKGANPPTDKSESRNFIIEELVAGRRPTNLSGLLIMSYPSVAALAKVYGTSMKGPGRKLGSSFLEKEKELAFSILQNSNKWWNLQAATEMLGNGFNADVTEKMTRDFLIRFGIAEPDTRKLLWDGIKCAQRQQVKDLKSQLESPYGLSARDREMLTIEIRRTDVELRRSIFLGEFLLGKNKAIGPWPRVRVSVTTGLENCGKSIYFRLSRLGSQPSAAFFPNWGRRGKRTLFTNSPRFRGTGCPDQGIHVCYLGDANASILRETTKLGGENWLPFSLD